MFTKTPSSSWYPCHHAATCLACMFGIAIFFLAFQMIFVQVCLFPLFDHQRSTVCNLKSSQPIRSEQYKLLSTLNLANYDQVCGDQKGESLLDSNITEVNSFWLPSHSGDLSLGEFALIELYHNLTDSFFISQTLAETVFGQCLRYP